MSNRYHVTGYFYEVASRKCRKYLDIKLKSSILEKPDLMVVMMNPGSSYPVDGIDDNCKPSIAVPDKTQYQIMKVMNNCSLQYARVLNLSDIRTADSMELYKFLRSHESRKFPHSIFLPERTIDFAELFNEDVPVILGWGVNKALAELSKLAVKTINHSQPIGVQKSDVEHAYYHPLPPVNKKQNEWVENISIALART